MRSTITARLLAGIAATALLAGLATAQEQEQEQEPTGGTAPAAEAPAPDVGTVLATVDGTEITLGHAIVMRDRLPEQYQNLPDDVLLQGIVDQLIDQTLLAARESASPDDDPLAVRLHVENERRGTLAARAVQERIAGDIDESEVQAAYDAQVAAFEPQTEYSASHILVATEAEAQDLSAQIAGGADFAELAKANSTDPGSGPNGGSLGWFGAGQMVPEFEAAVGDLEPGAVSEPVQTQFGWHIIKLLETRDTAPPPLDAVRPEIETALRQQKLEAELATLRDAATIERPETAVAPGAIRQSDLVGD